MKKNGIYRIGFIVLFILINIISCSKKDEPGNNGKTGTLQLNVFSSENDKMIINTLKSVPLSQYRVIIYTSENEIFEEFNHYEDIPSTLTLATGDYYVIAHSANDSVAAFENPYLYGESPVFTIGAGQVSTVDIGCEIMNCAVKIVYTENVRNNFLTYYTVVKNSIDSLVFIDTETRSGYFNIHPVSIYSVLTFELSDGSAAEKIIRGTIDSPEPGNIYAITIDGSYGNMQTGIVVTLDENLDTSFIELNDNLSVNDMEEGDLLITEIMYDPSAMSDTYGEWFEIYNNAPSPVNLYHLVLRSGAETYTVNESILMQPGEYFAFARTDTAFAGTKHIYSGISLINTTDEVSLYTYGSNGSDGTLIATVVYNESAGFPDGSGESINLCTNHFNFSDAQLASSWCLSTDTFNTGDYGTPGGMNKSFE